LKEAIARHVVTLREKQIVLVLGIDMRNAPTVRENLYRLTQAGKLDHLVVRSDRGNRPVYSHKSSEQGHRREDDLLSH